MQSAISQRSRSAQLNGRSRWSILGPTIWSCWLARPVLPDPELTKELKELSRQVSRYVKLGVTIAESEARRIHDDLRKVYDDMNELTLFKFVSGDDKIYVEQDFERYADLQAPIDSAVHESLIQTIRAAKRRRCWPCWTRCSRACRR